jgi:ethanolaminephosphotransferase
VVTLQTLQSLSLAGLPFILTTFVVPLLFSATLAFKLAFTAEDAPELVVGFAHKLLEILQGPSLIFRARIIFVLLTALFGFAVYRAKTGSPQVTQSAGKLSLYLALFIYLFHINMANSPQQI